MKQLFACLLLWSALLGAAHATLVTRDLGHGLVYHRVHRLPGDLPTAEDTRRHPCILDLRYTPGNGEEAAALAAWLKFHATPRAPVLVLANAETAVALRLALAAHAATPNVVVLGAAAADFTPDIGLKISAEADRHAYDAFESGTLLDALITENPDKPRNDEAKLAKDRQAPPDSPFVPAPDSIANGPVETKPKPPAPVVDAVLQRAVQLHRTLLALRKL